MEAKLGVSGKPPGTSVSLGVGACESISSFPLFLLPLLLSFSFSFFFSFFPVLCAEYVRLDVEREKKRKVCCCSVTNPRRNELGEEDGDIGQV